MRNFIRKRVRLPIEREYFTSILSGSEGGLATTTAIVIGLFISTEDRSLVVTTALIAFIVQAFNGAVGRFSSARTDHEIEQRDYTEGYKKPFYDAVIQLLSHVAASILVIAPIILVDDLFKAMISTVGLTLVVLFLLGEYKSYVLKNEPLRDGFELLIVGSLVICVGILSGFALR